MTLISLAALASFPRGKLKTMLPAGRKNISHLLLGEGARRADEGLLITLISLAALASFPQEMLHVRRVEKRNPIYELTLSVVGAKHPNITPVDDRLCSTRMLRPYQ